MSSTLGWIPKKPKDFKWLNDDIKYVMRKRYGDPIHTVIDSSQLDYLRGLRDSGFNEAEKLINAIDKYGEIEIKEEF